MSFEISPNIAVYVNDLNKAKEFYVGALGFKETPSSERWVELRSGPNNLFLMQSDSESGAVHELFVNDLEKAKSKLLAQGCEVIRWEGVGKDCYVRDPFGIIFNVWEQ